MGYAHIDIFNYRWFYPSDTVIATTGSDVEESSTSSTPQLLLELTLKNDINPDSQFRYKFDMREKTTLKFCDAGVYLNDTLIGTYHNYQGGWTTKTEDITTSGLKRGDKFQIYGNGTPATGGICQVKEFKICGEESLWEDTT